MAEAVYMKEITKYFGNFCALSGVNLNIEKGSIHALLGENGAGKTTIMNILYGLYGCDTGEIFINGNKENIKNPKVAIKLGIGMVHQHFMLVNPLTVVQNIILGQEVTTVAGILNLSKAKAQILELSEKYGLHVDPDQKIENISVGMQQRVEILKTLYRGAEILILDEPTAVLTPQEIKELTEIMQNLALSGCTVIIITHKLKEIKEMAQKCTIIRRGEYVDTVNVSDTTEDELASMMVGHKVNLHVNKEKADVKEKSMFINGVHIKDNRNLDRVKDLTLSVRKGEIVGIAGIDGNGQNELIEAICGMRKIESGKISVNNKEIQNKRPKEILDSGVATIPEDRQRYGLVLDFSVEENFVLEKYNKAPFSKFGFLQKKVINSFTKELIQKFDIRPSNSEKLPARDLSGGNQQKLILAREFANEPEVLLAVQPTRGLDVGAIEFVHKSIIEQRNKGKAVILVSFELDEIIDLSDRIAIIYDGKIVKELDNSVEAVDPQIVGLYMAGGSEHEK